MEKLKINRLFILFGFVLFIGTVTTLVFIVQNNANAQQTKQPPVNPGNKQGKMGIAKGQKNGMMEDMHQKRVQKMADGLGLQGEERTKFISTMDEFKNIKMGIHEKIKAARIELFKLAGQPTPNQKQINIQVAEITKLHEKMIKSSVEMLNKQRKNLTPEKFSQFITIMEQHRMDGMGCGCGCEDEDEAGSGCGCQAHKNSNKMGECPCKAHKQNPGKLP